MFFFQVDKLKRKRNLLETTHLLTEGVVGGQKTYINKKTSDDINKNKLIRKSLQGELSTKSHLADRLSVDSEPLQSGSSVELGNVESDSLKSNNNSEYQDKALAGRRHLHTESHQLNEINVQDVLEGNISLTEQQVTSFIKNRKSWPKFEEVFMISALNGTGVDDMRALLLSSAYNSPWIFSSQVCRRLND